MASILVGSLAGCGNGADKTSSGTKDDKKPSVVTIGYQQIPNDEILAKSKNWYEKELGVKVKFVQFDSGKDVNTAMTSKSLDIALLGSTPASIGISQNLPYEVFWIHDVIGKNEALVAKNKANINSIKDLKGKKIGVPFGSNAQPLVYLYLEKAGLTEKDVEILNVAAADIPATIVKGDIDAGVVWEPVLSVAAKEGNPVKLLATAEGIKYFVDPIIARSEFTEAHPEETAKLLRALNKAGEWSSENQQEAAEIVNKSTQVDLEALLITLSKKNLSSKIDQEWTDAFVQGEKDALKYELLKKDIDVLGHIKTEYLKAAGLDK